MITTLDDASRQQDTLDELVVTSFATSNALAKLLIEKGIITGAEFAAKVSAEKEIDHALLQKTSK
jgi:hypothetical protein